MAEARVVFGEKFILHSERINSEFLDHLSMGQRRFFLFNKRCSWQNFSVIDRRQISLTCHITTTLRVSKVTAHAVYQRENSHCFGAFAKTYNVSDGLFAVMEQLGILGSQIICPTLICFVCCY